MTVKDHATRFTVLIALPNKEGVTIATELERLFSIIGYPLVYHTDNAGELCGALAQDVLERLPRNSSEDEHTEAHPRKPHRLIVPSATLREIAGEKIPREAIPGGDAQDSITCCNK